jgi:hypothetical protein
MAQALTPEHVRYLMDNGLRRILRPDDSLPHQIRLSMHPRSQHIAVSCTCRRKQQPQGGYDPIEVRGCWQPGDAIAVWRAHASAAEAVTA